MKDAVLFVDDEVQVLRALQRALIDEDFEVGLAQSAAEGFKLLETGNFKVVVSDERMPGMSGSEFLSLLSLRHPEVVRITLTGHASIEAALKAVNQGEIYRFLIKPWNDMELRLAIRAGIEKYDMEMKNRKLLALVRIQAMKLEQIEKKHPGLTNIEKTEDGSFVLPDMSDEEVARIMQECGGNIPK